MQLGVRERVGLVERSARDVSKILRQLPKAEVVKVVARLLTPMVGEEGEVVHGSHHGPVRRGGDGVQADIITQVMLS